MRRRAPRGFTLIELGIVLGIAIFLTTAVAVTIKGVTQSARTQRTGDELTTLSRVAVTALKRGLVQDPALGTWSFRTTGGAATAPLSANTPLCYDLSRVQGAGSPNCPGSTAPGPNWSAPYYSSINALPAGSPILSVLGGTTLSANGGYNPWCLPYVICLYPMRAEVLTCVPRDDLDANGLESAMRCGPCNLTGPSGEDTACVLLGATAFNQSLPAVRMSFDPDELGPPPAGPYVSTPRTAF